ncbi:MAG: PAS domain S-box protein [Deltaproteobacteria bacterium]|nr:PAS domain S-box protein [Deltaproteobacteria bacterium]
MRNKLFFKVFIAYLAIVIATIAVMGFLSLNQMKRRLMAQIEMNLDAAARMINVIGTKTDIMAKAKDLAAVAKARVTFIDADGTVILDTEADPATMDNHLNRPEIQEVRVKGRGSATRYSRTLDMKILYIAYPLKIADSRVGYIRLGRPLEEIIASARQYTVIVLESLGLLIFVSFILAFLFTLRLTTPIQEMEQYTDRLRRGEQPPGSLLIHSGDEVGRLAQNINFIVAELQDSMERAREEKGKLEAIFASMNAGVMVLDDEERIESVNSAFRELFQVGDVDVVGKTCLEVLRNLDLMQAMKQYNQERKQVSREISLEFDEYPMFNATISPIKGLSDKPKTMLVVHDITRLKQLERVRADFVANVTHEIKTPLAAILGFIETLKSGALEEKDSARKFLDTIDRQARRLDRLVDDLLTISDIELGRTAFHFEALPPESLVDNVFPLIAERLKQKGIDFEKSIPGDIPMIWADRDRAIQIVLNIFDNAVKFTPSSGKILIKATATESGIVCLSIADTGIGIPKGELPRLGERFYRVDKTRSRDMGGTGLGLSIVKHLMRAHGGSINITSKLGKGTTVTLCFPAA